jgi:hypothetical protein
VEKHQRLEARLTKAVLGEEVRGVHFTVDFAKVDSP